MKILDLLYPKNCLECKRIGNYICEGCLKKVGTPKTICPQCLKSSIDGLTHFKCKKKLALDGAISIWNYQGVIRKTLLCLKYKFAYEMADELSLSALSVISKNDILNSLQKAVLVPIPTYGLRKNWRGFNQAEIIGRQIAKGMNWQFIADLLVKTPTQSQTGLEKEKRLKNVKGSFSLNPKYSPSQRLIRAGGNIPHSDIIIFDDVWTTGATVKEAAKVLKRAGFVKVWALTIARSQGINWTNQVI